MSDRILREELAFLLRRGNAHVDFETAISGLAPEFRGATPAGVPHTPWRLLEHMRIAQWDILEFCRDAKHVSPNFPDGYWPEGDAPPDDDAWEASIAAFREGLESMIDLIRDPATDLFARTRARRRSDDLSRGSVSGRSQCLSPGTNGHGAAGTGRVAVAGVAQASLSIQRRRSGTPSMGVVRADGKHVGRVPRPRAAETSCPPIRAEGRR